MVLAFFGLDGFHLSIGKLYIININGLCIYIYKWNNNTNANNIAEKKVANTTTHALFDTK